MHNRPFKLRPSGKDYLWGGNRLNEEFGKKIEMSPLAETWECSTHPDGPSFVVSGEFDGKTLAQVLYDHPEYMGNTATELGEFPILIKFIDAKSNLSVQVHPSDEYANIRENGQLGKTEMWYIVDADEEASLVYGLKTKCERDEIESAIRKGTLEKYLNKIKVKKDEIYFIEAGTIHAINKGCLIAEIQENSNLTYRMYDYNRVGKDGKLRELHIEKALDVSKLEETKEQRQTMRVLKYIPGAAEELLCRCEKFEVHRILLNNFEKKESLKIETEKNSFIVLLCLEGNGIIETENERMEYCKGECIFVPANSGQLCIKGSSQILKVRC